MYAFIEGKVVERNPAYAVLETNGIGFLFQISLNTYTKLGENAHFRLFTHLVIREDAQQLFGFADEDERDLFRMLISVSGVGPNTARLLLSSMGVQELKQAIANAQVAVLKSVKGIGEKSAQRIIVDLKDKLDKVEILPEKIDPAHNTLRQEALSGLVVLGFPKKVANAALEKALKAHSGKELVPGLESSLTVEFLIKEALKNL